MTTPKRPDKVTSISVDTETLDIIKAAASKLAIPFTVFIRMAAKKEADRVLRAGGRKRAA